MFKKGADVVFEKLPEQSAKPFSGSETSVAKSWSQVVKNDSPVHPKVTFDFIPPPEGSKVVTPPDAVLIKDNDRLKTSVVGTITKGVASYSKVCKFAANMWDKRGLVHIAHTFLFKFDNETSMNNALAKGTWYIEKQPMLIHAWGSTTGCMQNIPPWVSLIKFRIPTGLKRG